MTLFTRTVAAAVVGASLCTGALAADADREAAGWHKWADFTENVVAGGRTKPLDPRPAMAACDGATGVVSGQGFQFPYWAQNVMMACRVFDTFKDVNDKVAAGVDKGSSAEYYSNMMKTILKREKRGLCRAASRASGELGKAEPVAAEPRAQPLALELKAQMESVLDMADCR